MGDQGNPFTHGKRCEEMEAEIERMKRFIFAFSRGIERPRADAYTDEEMAQMFGPALFSGDYLGLSPRAYKLVRTVADRNEVIAALREERDALKLDVLALKGEIDAILKGNEELFEAERKDQDTLREKLRVATKERDRICEAVVSFRLEESGEECDLEDNLPDDWRKAMDDHECNDEDDIVCCRRNCGMMVRAALALIEEKTP